MYPSLQSIDSVEKARSVFICLLSYVLEYVYICVLEKKIRVLRIILEYFSARGLHAHHAAWWAGLCCPVFLGRNKCSAPHPTIYFQLGLIIKRKKKKKKKKLNHCKGMRNIAGTSMSSLQAACSPGQLVM